MYNPKMDVDFDYRSYLIYDCNVPAEVVDTMTIEEMIEESVRIDREGQSRIGGF